MDRIDKLTWEIKNRAKRNLVFLLLAMSCLQGFSQTRLKDVQTDRISFEKVDEFLNHQIDLGIVTFEDIKPSLYPDSIMSDFDVIDREYMVKDNIENVWNHYVNAGLQNSWNSKRVQYGFAYARENDSVYYADDDVGSLRPGIIVYLDLKVMLGVKELVMAFEVTRVDPLKKLIEFSYIEGNASDGKQQIFFESTPKGHTLITHLSYYRCKPKTRQEIYPHVHAKLINQFHRNMKRMYKEKMTTVK